MAIVVGFTLGFCDSGTFLWWQIQQMLNRRRVCCYWTNYFRSLWGWKLHLEKRQTYLASLVGQKNRAAYRKGHLQRTIHHTSLQNPPLTTPARPLSLVNRRKECFISLGSLLVISRVHIVDPLSFKQEWLRWQSYSLGGDSDWASHVAWASDSIKAEVWH